MEELLINKNITFTSYVQTLPNINLELDIYDADFILHDGPPFANGNLHAGHGVNKLLKDFINRLYILYGYKISYIPGWDCHGLPIENAIEKKYKNIDINICKEYAQSWIEIQKQTFKRLGVLGTWNKPYITMNNDYEYNVISALYKLIEQGYIIRGKKPIMWSISEQTSLSDAEIEYKDIISKSIYVLFPSNDSYIMIWTTTPWTILANKAICYNKNIKYKCIKIKNKKIWLAESFIDIFAQKLNISYEIIDEIFPSIAYHPISKQTIPIIHGDHVMDNSTGFVHTAPAYGLDDFNICKQYNIELVEIIDKYGNFTLDILSGLKINNCFDRISELLHDHLILSEDYKHSYPHSWRSKKPLIYMLSDQWFFDLNNNNLKEKILNILKFISFYPDISSNRMFAMIQNRNDWCISRQRKWGIPLMFCLNDQGEIDLTMKDQILSLVKEKGTSIWFDNEMNDLFPNRIIDIMDVWLESGLSYLILDKQADLYLEGSDQHRGWFQSSLITSMALLNRAPYKAIMTHGFIVSQPGEKLSKSKGSQSLDTILDQYGPDIFRIFVANNNCIGHDITFNDISLQNAKNILYKLRNTIRFLIANIQVTSFERLEYHEYSLLDKYILHLMYQMNQSIVKYMKEYQINRIFKLIIEFNHKISYLYLDVIKDSLYCDKNTSKKRCAIVTILEYILNNLASWLKIFIPFTIEEVSLLMNNKYEKIIIYDYWYNESLAKRFDNILKVREKIMKLLEEERNKNNIKSNLEAYIEYPFKEDEKLMEDILIVSNYKYSEQIRIYNIGNKCSRCWKYYITECKRCNA